MDKEKKENIIKTWFKLAEPNKFYFAMQILFYIVYTVFLTIITIFAAKTINCLYEQNWEGAFFYLFLELLTIVIRCLAYHFQYTYFGKQYMYIRKVIARKIFNKILKSDFSKKDGISKEKVANIAFNNSGDSATFADTIAAIISYSIQVIITLTVIFIANVWAGLIVFVLGIFNFFCYRYYNKKLGSIRSERYTKKDDMFHSYSKIIDGSALINEYRLTKEYENEVVESVRNHAKSYAKYYEVSSLKTNMHFVTWNFIVYITTALLIYFVSNGNLSLEIYLIIVPYLSSGTQKLTDLFDLAKYFENMKADVNRINLIMNMNEKEIIQYGQIVSDTPMYNLGLIDVSYQNKDKNSKFYGKLIEADISFMMNKINLIKGEKGSGKRQIFNLLRRYIKPDNGIILLDNLNLLDYDEKTFKSHINYCSSHPSFINGTIKENLLIVNKDQNQIDNVCKQVGVYETISKMPDGFNTKISQIDQSSTLFLIGLARAVLSNCKILMIYEIPEDAPDKFRNNVKSLLKNYTFDKTVIVFTHSDKYDNLADITYEISKGKIKRCYLGQNKKRKTK